MELDLVSVIVPIYNTEKYLKRCIDSILNQTYKNIELILIDDGSLDSCSEICDEYARVNNNVNVIHKKNEGVSIARNIGIKSAKGKFITFVDSDDFLHNYYIEKMIFLMNKFEVSIVQCSFECGSGNFKPGKNKEKVVFLNDSYMYGDRRVKITVCGKLYRTEILQGIEFPAGRRREDEFFTYKAISNAGGIVITDAKYYYYYNNPNSYMRTKKNLISPSDFIMAYNERFDFFRERNDAIAIEMSKKEFAIRLMVFYLSYYKYNLKDLEYTLILFKNTYNEINMHNIFSFKERFLMKIFYNMPKVCAVIYNVIR